MSRHGHHGLGHGLGVFLDWLVVAFVIFVLGVVQGWW